MKKLLQALRKDWALAFVTFTYVIACGVAGFAVAAVDACSRVPPAVSTVELDLCRARASWRVVAAAAGGALDPTPGSVRARLEQAEDAFCSARDALEPDSPPAGSKPPPSSTPPDAGTP